MQLSWHGQYTVKIVSKDTTLVLDPCGIRAKAEIIGLSNPADREMSNISGIQGKPLVIDTPGEYSFREYSLHAIGWNDSDGNERNLQRWMVEDIVILHVGSLNRDLNEQELRELERVDIDVFLVPVGGENSLSLPQAMKMISTIEPRIVIPINYTSVKQFAEEMGVSALTPEKKLVLKKSKLPQEDMQTVILAP